MRTSILSVVASLAVASLLLSAGAGARSDAPRLRARIDASDPSALRSTLEAAGYDVLQIDSATSTVDVVVSR